MIEEIETGEMKGMIGMMIIAIMMIVDEMIEEWMIEEIERGGNEMKGTFSYVTKLNSKCNSLISNLDISKTCIFRKERKKKSIYLQIDKTIYEK